MGAPYIYDISHLRVNGFLGPFAKLRKTTISFVMSVCSSIRPAAHMQQLSSHWMDIHKILYLSIFRKYVEKMQVLLTSDKNKGWDLCSYGITRSANVNFFPAFPIAMAFKE